MIALVLMLGFIIIGIASAVLIAYELFVMWRKARHRRQSPAYPAPSPRGDDSSLDVERTSVPPPPNSRRAGPSTIRTREVAMRTFRAQSSPLVIRQRQIGD